MGRGVQGAMLLPAGRIADVEPRHACPQLFLQRALMPLHKPKCVAMYHQQLAYCVTQVGSTEAQAGVGRARSRTARCAAGC